MIKKRTNYLVKIGMLSAISFLLQLLGSIMGLKIGGFLEIELSDLPALIGTFALGPLAGVAIEFIKNLLHCFVTSTGFIGEGANFIVNGIFVLVSGILYKHNRTRRGAVIGMVVSVIAMTAAAMLANLFILLPLYMPAAAFSDKLSLVFYTITPFNLCKGTALSILTFLLYKHLTPLLKQH